MENKYDIARTTPLAKEVLVTIPAKAAYDLQAMFKITERVLGELGCPTCHSGHNIRFDLERRFRFDDNLELIR